MVPIVLWIQAKISLLTWIYSNVLVITICKGLTEVIQSYHEHIKYCLSKWESVGNTNNVKINTIRWNKQCNDLRDIYVETRKLVNATSKFIWPLVLICCGMNIYFIINKVKKIQKINVIMLQKILIINICLCSCTV